MSTPPPAPDKRDPEQMIGPGGLSMRQIHVATLKSLELERQAPARKQADLSWWRRLLKKVFGRG
ncbi:hypothetical protein [Chitinivorax sp. B]|uniref:hypothetical protein n=1 Tax=Chitinivorax sp. B TaxID=2502235 RepID=UPI0010F48E02|nr:hypothetical protein [Chitinivorax sp. B]